MSFCIDKKVGALGTMKKMNVSAKPIVGQCKPYQKKEVDDRHHPNGNPNGSTPPGRGFTRAAQDSRSHKGEAEEHHGRENLKKLCTFSGEELFTHQQSEKRCAQITKNSGAFLLFGCQVPHLFFTTAFLLYQKSPRCQAKDRQKIFVLIIQRKRERIEEKQKGGLILKTKTKRIFTLWTVIFLSFAVFFGGAYGYLKLTMKKGEQPAENKTERVPYYNALPEDVNLLWILPDKSQILFSLLFSRGCLNVIFADETPRERYCGAAPDYTVRADHTFLGDFIDRFGGLTLTVGGETLRYTGVQVTDLFSVPREEPTLNAVVTSLLNTISQVGFTKQDLTFLIEHTNTDLSLPDCYDWDEYIPDLCRNPQFFRCAESSEP